MPASARPCIRFRCFVVTPSPSTFYTRQDAETWLTGERHLIAGDSWTSPKKRAELKYGTKSTTLTFGKHAAMRRDMSQRQPDAWPVVGPIKVTRTCAVELAGDANETKNETEPDGKTPPAT